MISPSQADSPRGRLLLAGFEASLIALALLAANYAGSGMDLEFVVLYEPGLGKIAVAAAICMLCMYFFDLYGSFVLHSRRELLARLVLVLGASCSVMAVLYYIYPVAQLGRSTAAIAAAGISLLVWRRLYFTFTRVSQPAQRALLLGDGKLAAPVAAAIDALPELGIELVGAVGTSHRHLRALGDVQRIEEITRREKIARVIVAADEANALPPAALVQLQQRGVLVQTAAEFYNDAVTRVPAHRLPPESLMFAGRSELSPLVRFDVRLVLLALSSLALMLAVSLAAPAFVFWSSLLVAAYAYAVYPLLLFLLYAVAQLRRDLSYLAGRRDRRAAASEVREWPAVSLIIPAHNEARAIATKLANVRSLDYPADKLEIVFVSDGSDDGTSEMLQAAGGGNIKVLVLPERGGKAVALNHGIAAARHDLLVLSDTATLFDPPAIQRLVRHFSNPAVGAACGALRFYQTAESRQTEGVYWQYESMIRLMEGRLGATLTASGAIYAVRRECFPVLPPGTVVEDFLVPMHARRLGYQIVYDPEATAVDVAAATVADEFTRRVRLASGSFQALRQFARFPLRGLTCWAFFSHKVLRWTIPAALLLLLASSAMLAATPIYRAALVAQLMFYAWAAAGLFFRYRLQRVRFGLVGYFLLAMNAALLVGFVRFLLCKEDAKWQQVSHG